MAPTSSALIHDIAPGVGYLRTLIVNVFFLHDPQRDGSWVLTGCSGHGPYRFMRIQRRCRISADNCPIRRRIRELAEV
jgi:hypothetical protein